MYFFILLKFYGTFFSRLDRCTARLKISMGLGICIELQGHMHEPVEYISKCIGTDITDEVEFENTRKGGQFILHKGFRFIKSSLNNNKIHYRCSFYNKKCRAKVSLKDGKVYSYGDHDHEPTSS